MTSSNIRILGLSGSLRRDSYNSALLRTVEKLSPSDLTVDIFDLRSIPLYDDDVWKEGFPAAVTELRARAAAADALMIATPEYNYSIPGVLKNAIDWASRPPAHPFAGKPVAILGATTGALGTSRAQYHLRQCCVFLDMHPLNKPEILVPQAASKFDANGYLTDGPTQDLLWQMLTALTAWVHRLGKTG